MFKGIDGSNRYLVFRYGVSKYDNDVINGSVVEEFVNVVGVFGGVVNDFKNGIIV